MKRVLTTGMSGTGKSALIQVLAERGYRAIDLDTDTWSEWAPLSGDGPPGTSADPGTVWEFRDWVWREDRVERLLASDDTDILFVGGTASNQGKFHRYFDQIILLSAPLHILAERLASRTGNDYGKDPNELARVLEQVETVEPLLRRAATLEIDTDVPLDHVLWQVLEAVQL